MLYLNLVYTLYMVCKCMSHIYRKNSRPTFTKTKTKFNNSYYRILRQSHILLKYQSNNKFYITTKHNTRTTFSNYFYPPPHTPQTHVTIAKLTPHLMYNRTLNRSQQRNFEHHEQHNQNNTKQNKLYHNLSINTQQRNKITNEMATDNRSTNSRKPIP